MKKSISVDDYIKNKVEWSSLMMSLRKLLISTDLNETIKWGAPVYTYQNKNVLGLGAFKSYVSLWFFNGVFLKDEQKMLINAQEGVTKALRQWRFSNEEEIVRNCNLIKQYVFEAIEIEKQGKSIKPAKTKKVIFPLELKSELDNNYEFKRSFESFSLAKQREFAEHIAQAKKNETRISRLQKVISNVLSGEGLNDKYKKKQR